MFLTHLSAHPGEAEVAISGDRRRAAAVLASFLTEPSVWLSHALVAVDLDFDPTSQSAWLGSNSVQKVFPILVEFQKIKKT
jgi:hypothetical protein